ncbi:DUF1801 domain-containing protein [Caldimonas brevitalea]|uniref:YdhG-like domain-containing protein n=1 Tax=Caldimonas brevitalea TaxID=413882 RepID=A0A0G3BDR3_9BURK|nr:DUF1801 domain-containing protein [Caldimonas brevitalea]AKJ27559.1 hypothetical protein AAW51_0868 [Caldimonas brevitalea]
MTPFTSKDVAAKFDTYPLQVRRKMLALRELVFRTARQTPGVGEIQETLKWGEPAYVTPNKAGSTVRMDWKAKAPGRYAMYFHCQTDLVETFRRLFPADFRFEGNRALVFDLEQELKSDALAFCIAASLTYHLQKRQAAPGGQGSVRPA